MSSSAPDLPAIMKVYLSGPITGVEDWQTMFAAAETDLVGRGIEVFNPAAHQDAGVPAHGPAAYKHYMALELPQVIESDAVVVLPGWERSTGCGLEVHTAVTCGIPVLSYPHLEPVDTHVIVGRRTQTQLFPTDTKDEWIGLWNGPLQPPSLPDDGKHIVTNAVTGGQKETRPARFDLLPWDQLWKVAELYAYGATKYEDRNWEKGYAFSLSVAALHRHMAKFVQGENDDPESGCPHLASVVFHALALMRFVDGTQLDLLPTDLDDRPVGKQVRAREDVR